jgi:YVTN family beta-propeller protein
MRAAIIVALAAAGAVVAADKVSDKPAAPAAAPIVTVPGMPPVVNRNNIYSETNGPAYIAAAVKGDLERVYVPNLRSNDVSVIDPVTLKVVDKFKVGKAPQHVIPSWDLRTLWVANNAERTNIGSLTPIDPRTGKPGKEISVDDPYNLYFTPDGKSAIVVAEAKHRLDFRDPQTMAMQYSIEAPKCGGINHADFSIDGRYALFTCEFEGSVAKIDLVERKVLGYLKLNMPSTRFKDVPPSDAPFASEICSSKKACRRTYAFRRTANASTSPTWKRTVCTSSMATPSRKSASSRPVWAHTASTLAATASSSTWPTAAPTASTAAARYAAA